MPASARPSTPSRPSGENRRAVAPHDQRIVSISSRNLIDAVLRPGIHWRVQSETSCSRAPASSRSGQRAFSGGQHHSTQRRRVEKGIAPVPECQAICNSMSSSARSTGASRATVSIITGAFGAYAQTARRLGRCVQRLRRAAAPWPGRPGVDVRSGLALPVSAAASGPGLTAADRPVRRLRTSRR